jgi:hypothetical protein
MVPPLVADGSAAADSRPVVRIDRSNDVERYRWTCPEGHVDWAPTNSHAWCYSCSRIAEQGHDVDPEFYAVYDKKNDTSIPWTRVKLLE